MGRGRAKAKQTKVARELKYSGPQTDFDRLQAELSSTKSSSETVEVELEDELAHDDVYVDDPYAKYYEDDEEEDDK